MLHTSSHRENRYDSDALPADNAMVAYAAFGEGWHNYHHRFPYDYATSEFGVSSQFNVAKLFIDTLAALGLVWERKRATSVWALLRSRRDAEVSKLDKVH